MAVRGRAVASVRTEGWRGRGPPPQPALPKRLLAAAYPEEGARGGGGGGGDEQDARRLAVIEAEAELGVPVDVAWDWVTAPGQSIFRSIDKLAVRRVVQEDPVARTRLVEVDMTLRWRLLMLTGTFANRSLRFEDHATKEMRFQEAPGQRSIWRRFDGHWKFESIGPQACRVSMTQYALPPRVMPVPGGHRGLRSALRGVVSGIFDDLVHASNNWEPAGEAACNGALTALGAPPMLM